MYLGIYTSILCPEFSAANDAFNPVEVQQSLRAGNSSESYQLIVCVCVCVCVSVCNGVMIVGKYIAHTTTR